MPAKNQRPINGESMEGRYANYFEIGHNAFEFLVDFGQLYSEASEGQMHTRIVTNPLFAKRLAGVLNRALSQYEQSYGRIREETGEEYEAPRRDNIRPMFAVKTP